MDRGDEQLEQEMKRRTTREGGVELAFNALHGSLWQMPCVQQLQQLTGARKLHLPQCALGGKRQKWTTLLCSPRLL